MVRTQRPRGYGNPASRSLLWKFGRANKIFWILSHIWISYDYPLEVRIRVTAAQIHGPPPQRVVGSEFRSLCRRTDRKSSRRAELRTRKTPSELSPVRQIRSVRVMCGSRTSGKCIRMYALNRHQECDFSHFLTTRGMGHAVDSPLSSVWSYSCPQHSYNLRSCASHLDGLYVFLFKHACRSQAVPTHQKGHQFHLSVG